MLARCTAADKDHCGPGAPACSPGTTSLASDPRLLPLTATVLLAAGLSGCLSVPGWHADPPTTTFVSANRFVLEHPNQEVIGQLHVVVAEDADTLPSLARRYDVGYDEIVGANPGVDVWLPGAGTRVVLPTRYVLPAGERSGIVINVAARRLFYFPAHDQTVVHTYPIGVGRRDWSTPLGSTTVADKIVDPSWYPPASIRREHREKGDPLPGIVPPGPDNPLGRYALLLSMDGYLIHGTNKPAGVGMPVSHGCIRLYPEDIAALFAGLPVGTPVSIVDQPLLAGWDGDELYLQSYHSDAESAPDDDAIAAVVRTAMQRRGIDSVRVRLDREQMVRWTARRAVPLAVTRAGDALDRVLRTAAIIDRSEVERH